MNEAIAFTRETIARAKELGISCFVMANGSYGYTGSMDEIFAAKGEVVEQLSVGWSSDDKAKQFTWGMLRDLLMRYKKDNPNTVGTISMRPGTQTQIEIDIGMTWQLNLEFNQLGIVSGAYIEVASLQEEDFTRYYRMDFETDPSRVLLNECEMESGVLEIAEIPYRFKLDAKLSEMMLPIPSYLLASLQEFLMHMIVVGNQLK